MYFEKRGEVNNNFSFFYEKHEYKILRRLSSNESEENDE